MQEKKKILIPGGKLSDWALVNAAHRLGLYVITSGTNKAAPAHYFADEYVYADYSDKEAMLALAKEKKIDYMCSCANDFGMISTAYVCEQLDLPGHDSYETTLTIHHKDRFKPLANKLGLHTPVSEVFDKKEDAIGYIRNAGRLMILKPADNVASKGVSVPRTEEEIRASVDLAFSQSKEKKIIVEPYIEGFFVTTTAMLIDQEVVCFFADSSHFYPEGEVIGPEFPMNVRNTGVLRPAPYIDEFAPPIIEDLNKLARELKLVDGKFHCELLVTPEKEAWIFDAHRRMSGFDEPWPQWNLTTGLRWEDWIVRAECGMDLSDFPRGIRQNRFFHARDIYAPRDGIIKRLVFDEYLTSHMYPPCSAKEFEMAGLFVTDHLHNPLVRNFVLPTGGPVFFEFDSPEEAAYVGSPEEDHFYNHIRFEYDE